MMAVTSPDFSSSESIRIPRIGVSHMPIAVSSAKASSEHLQSAQ